jgi:TolA-binding protein
VACARPATGSRLPWQLRVGVGLAAALLGCATENALRKDLNAVREELATQRQANEEQRRTQDELRIRVEQLEAHALRSPPAAATPAPMSDESRAEFGSLPVVRIAPPHALAAAAEPRIPPRDSAMQVAGADDQPVNLNEILDRHTPVEAAFTSAMSLYSAGDLKGAAAAFKRFVVKFPRHELVPKALYMHGIALSGDERCGEALPLFNQVLKSHPTSESVSPALLSSAQCEVKLGHPDRARPLLQRIVTEHGASAEAAQAKVTLAELDAGDRS